MYEAVAEVWAGHEYVTEDEGTDAADQVPE
jgi:hypothetical protein